MEELLDNLVVVPADKIWRTGDPPRQDMQA